MVQKRCSKKDCNKEAISFSKFCGKHTSNKEIIHKLKNTRLKNLKSIYLDEVEIKKIVFTGKNFISATIQDTDFNEVVFKDCSFKASGFSNAVLSQCKFINCYFYQWDCKDVTFTETAFERCTFEDWQLNQCLFSDETAITDSTVDSCEITGGFFSETGIFKNVKFLSTNFLQASFAQAKFSECQFIDVDFLKTSLYDSAFTSCYFDTISHDFAITGIPQLCDFRDTRFINMSIPKNFSKWNNLKKDPILFFSGMAEMLTSLKHPNYLADLAVVLSYLQKLNVPIKAELVEKVRLHFKYLVNEAYTSSDYRTLGNIMSEFGKIPEEYRRNTGFMLPPPENSFNQKTLERSKLLITAQLQEWTLEKVCRFIILLTDLEKELPPSIPQTVNYIERGSIIIEIWGGLKSLVAMVRSIADLKNTTIDGKLKEMELKKKALELRKEKIDIKYYEKTKKLESEKAEAEVIQMKLALIDTIEKKTGFNFKEYWESNEGKKAKKIGGTIQLEFPVIDIRIEE